ncbi:unnamed protein product [Dracunculus medinensis]|uniref:G_PROTEIN_RECEP_F1_2 domain-containing protein n=1 Tax=Dracunculus medinensis TaxID=318479 RepID=A0A0N4UM29_DRAME|nr:unnamed protein product [Dracunculus medinensis]
MDTVLKEDRDAALIVGTLGIFGIILNGLSIYTVLKTTNLRNAFGYSTISHAIGGMGVLLIFSIWVAPILFGLVLATSFIADCCRNPERLPHFMSNARLSYTIGQLCIWFYYASIYTHCLITINRYMAISKPFSYNKYFKERITLLWIALVWIISFLQSCAYQFGLS